jgi:ABC-type Fe3+/spermidine/putrescine transport system ATPase subunit
MTAGLEEAPSGSQARAAEQPLLEFRGISKRFDRKVVAEDLNLTIGRGEFFTFLGPSGSGKSTGLRLVAGLETADAGAILIQGRDMRGVPPWKRNVGMVFQQYALFPHMSVAQNVAYGLKVRGMKKAGITAEVDALLSMVGLTGMANKNATLLSGGEQQRVALARALAPEPLILLLDEPLSALDEKIRREMQVELKHIQRRTGTTFLYVTHDQEEALTMSDRIAVLNDGRAVQVDRPEVLFRRPRTRFVAQFFRGCNVLAAEAAGVDGESADIVLAGKQMAADRNGLTPRGRAVSVAIRSESISVGNSALGRSVQMDARLHEVIYRGTNNDYDLELADGQRLVATSTRREVEGSPEYARIGFESRDVILLAD